MAQQDDIIIIKTVENITTSVLDYFLNIALVTAIEQEDLLPEKTFDPSGMETYASLPAVAETFATTSKIYGIAKDIFNQKTNMGVNQSNLRRLVVIEKKKEDATFEACLNRVGYKNSYFVLINQKLDSDISDANNWLGSQRKLLMSQSTSEDVISSGSSDIASTLKDKKAGRCVVYYHSKENESLNGALTAILASYPIGGKSASYKKPTGITVDRLSDAEEGYLASKNVNYYVPYIGGAGDYSTRYLTSDNGVTLSGDEIEKVIAIDRTILSLQASLMDALEQDIPYDDNGGTIVYDKINTVFSELKNEGIFAEDSVDQETGEMTKSYTINVLTRATVKKHFPDYFAQKMFVVECEIQLAGSGKKVMLTLAY